MTRKELRTRLVEIGVTAERALKLEVTHRLLMCAVAGYESYTGIDGDRPVSRFIAQNVENVGEKILRFYESGGELAVLTFLSAYVPAAKKLGRDAYAMNLRQRKNGHAANGKAKPKANHPFRRKNNYRANKAMRRKIKPSEVF